MIEDKATGPLLAEVLAAHGHSVIPAPASDSSVTAWASANNPDLIIFNVHSPKKYLQAIYHLDTLPVIIFAEDDSILTINQIVKAGVSAYIVNSLETGRINSIVNIAMARFKEQQSLKKNLLKTQRKLQERQLIDRAKGVLIKTRGLTEDDAYCTLRKLAMNSNMTIGEIAKNVISMTELFK